MVSCKKRTVYMLLNLDLDGSTLGLDDSALASLLRPGEVGNGDDKEGVTVRKDTLVCAWFELNWRGGREREEAIPIIRNTSKRIIPRHKRSE